MPRLWYTFLCWLTMFSAMPVYAQRHAMPEHNRSLIVKAGVLSPLAGAISLQLERPIDGNISIQPGIFVLVSPLVSGRGIRGGGFGLTNDFRFYLENENQEGMYVQPYLRYQNYYLENIPQRGTTVPIRKIDVNVVGGGLLLGFQRIFFKRLVVDYYAGPMYNRSYGSASTLFRDLPPMIHGYWFRSGIAIGYKF